MQLSGGLYSYNRFDAYEASLEENREAAYSAGESEGKKEMRNAGKAAKVTGGKTRVEMGKDGKPLFKESDEMDEAYKGKHGQSEKEYQDGRSMAGKMISGDSKGSGANYSYRAKNTGPNPAGGSVRPQGQAKMNNKDRAYLQMQKGSMKKEEVEITKEMVVEYLVSEGYATNEVSAEILHTHISDGFLAQIEEQMLG